MNNMTETESEIAAAFAAPNHQPQPTPPASTVKKVSFGGVKKKKEETKTVYPVFPDTNGQAAIIAARIKQRQQDFDALEGALKTDKAELKVMVAQHYFAVNHGKHEVPSSIAVNSPAGEVLVNFQNRYSLMESDELVSGNPR